MFYAVSLSYYICVQDVYGSWWILQIGGPWGKEERSICEVKINCESHAKKYKQKYLLQNRNKLRANFLKFKQLHYQI